MNPQLRRYLTAKHTKTAKIFYLKKNVLKFKGLFLRCFYMDIRIDPVLLIIAIICIAVIYVVLPLLFIGNIITTYKKRKACQSSRHDWNGCECNRCGEEIHEWEDMTINDKKIIHQIKCKKCGKETKKVINK